MTVSLVTPTLSLTPASDTGVSHTDGITNEQVPVFAGTATPGAAVTVTDATSGQSVTTLANAYGDFKVAFAGLDAGVHALTASSALGENVSPTSNPYNIDIETDATATSTIAAVPETAASVTFAVHFDQPVSTITPASFALVTTGDAYGNVESVSGSGEDYTVTVAGLGGTGDVGLAFSDTPPTDLAGNQIVLASTLHEVADTVTGVDTTVSADQSGVQGTGANPAVSGGGRVVSFISDDSALVPGVQTTSGVGNLYVKDLQTGAIVQVTNGDDETENAQISINGSTVAFSSLATNLVPGGTTPGQLNLYVAKLNSALSSGGISLVAGSIQLVGKLDDSVAAEDKVGFALSGDGTTLAYEGDSTTPGAPTDSDTDYLLNLTTGTQTQFATDGDITSISQNGTKVAYTAYVDVPGTGGEPDTYFGGTYPPNVIQDAFVYNSATGSVITIDGSGLLPDTDPPLGAGQDADYLTADPVLSGDGSTVVFQVSRPDEELASLFSINLANPSVISPVSPDAGSGGGTEDDFGQTVSQGGGVIAYTSGTAGYYEAEVYTPSTGTTTDLGSALQTTLTNQGNAVVYAEPAGTGFEGITYEDTLGVSASIAPIDDDDMIDAIDLRQAKTQGLAVSGTSNAPPGSAVLLYILGTVEGASASPTFYGAVGDGGIWTATIPATVAATLTDGVYALLVQVLDANGASPKINRLFTIDTVAPPQPVITGLDPDSSAGLGQNGTPLTNTATPTIDGVATPLSQVSLYADNAAGIPEAIESAQADENGVFVITAPHLADGIQDLEVQAVDPAGNPSPFSSSLEIIVDTTPPAAPPPPILLYYTYSPDGLVVDDSSLSFLGRAEPDSDVTLLDADTGDIVATGIVSEVGTYGAVTDPLPDGTYDIEAYATDQAGNVGQPSSPVRVTIDTQAPDQPTILGVTGGVASDGSLSPALDLSGDAEPFSLITLQVDGAPDTSEPTATADDDGAFDLQTANLPAGTHTLTVTATDFAGNVSDVSAPEVVTISATPVPPPGEPPGTLALTGTLSDGPISGATVFADANGNGQPDSGEATAVTSTTGQFTLLDPSGELVATGGTDTETGLALPGALTAPADSVVIDPLTTLLDAYAVAVGETPQAAQPALLTVLGLDPTTDLTQTDPETAAAAGDPSLLIASAQVMDSAVLYARLVAAQTGVSLATAFAASFTALAQQAATGTLDLLLDAANTLANLATAAAAIADPGFVLPNGLATDAATILGYGNHDLSSVSGQTDPSAALATVEAIERVEQGQAAPQFAAAADDQAEADLVTQTYSYDLPTALTAAENPVLAPPVLAPLDDTGVSAQDNITSDTTPTFTGTAPPGATVILAVQVLNEPGTYSIVGSGTANEGGGYAVATVLPAGQDDVVAFQAAAGEATASGTQFDVSTALTSAQVTEVTVGDLPENSGAAAAPTIDAVQYTASAANDATATSLYITGDGSYDIQEGAFYTVTANGNPVTAFTAQGNGNSFGVQTTPLPAGTYSLVVTETALDGESVQSAPTTVTVTAPGSLSLEAEAAGPVAGGSIGAYDRGETALAIYPEAHPDVTTDASGAASVPAQATVPAQGSSLVDATDANGLEMDGGQDALTGLILPVNLFAPPGASVITPATSLLTQADADAATDGFDATGIYAVTAADYAYENSRIDTALDLPTTLDLATADPLAMAEAGDPTLFLKDVELLDTVFLLVPFTEDGDAGTDTADPLYVIDKSLFIFKFDDFDDGMGPAITTPPIDFTSATQVLSWLTTDDTTLFDGSYDTIYDASVLPTVAAIIAASNAAIETHAAASTSLADTISYALAVERVALSGEEQALAAQSSNYTDGVAAQQAGFATLQADYTGPGLQAAVAAALAQTVQVTGFAPASASTGAAQETFTITFSAPVGGVTAGDFIVSGSAGLAGESVTAVAPVAGSDGAAYTVTVATGVGEGTLTLGFTPNGLTNPDGSPLTTGTFGAPQTYSTPLGVEGEESLPQGLATGDFNGDGHTDVVIANGSADGLTLFLGQGDGTFVAEPAIYTGSNGTGSNGAEGASEVVAGDFNGDGKLDAVTLNDQYQTNGESAASDLTVSAMLGNGNGTFAGPIQTDVGPSAVDIVAGDFNGDGKLDLAVLDSPTNGGDGSVQIFFGNGDGTFSVSLRWGPPAWIFEFWLGSRLSVSAG